MPSLFEQLLAQNLTSMRDGLGTSGCTYTPPDGVAIVNNLTLRVQREQANEIDRPTRISGEMQTADVIVLQADLPNCVREGRFTVPGLTGPEVWTIQASPLVQNGEFICRCMRTGIERYMPRRQKQ